VTQLADCPSQSQDGVSGSESDLKDFLTLLDSELLQARIRELILTTSGKRIVPPAHLVVVGSGFFFRPCDSTHLHFIFWHFLPLDALHPSPRPGFVGHSPALTTRKGVELAQMACSTP
jgi:hypothetical protein